MTNARAYRATIFGEPVHIRPTLNETSPCHADMLRYDGAFCDPGDLSIVVFPIWKTPSGRLHKTITFDRWRSFVIKLAELDAVDITDEWITYVHGPRYELVKMTFGEYLKQNPKYKIAGWR